MSVYIDSISFADEYTSAGGGGVAFLLGSVGDKITATINLTIKWNSLSIPVVFNATNQTITRTDNGSFIRDGFRDDDTFTVVDSSSNNGNKVIDTVTDLVITTVGALVNETSVGVTLHGTTPVTALDFYYNLIENTAAEDFTSLSDRETKQKFNVSGLSDSMAAATFTTPTNSKGWINGSATIDDGVFTTYEQKYVITHTFFITPLFLASQLANLQNGLPPAPDYFKNGNALKYICQLDAKFSNIDPNITHTSEGLFTFKYGNTGWFDEFLNGIDPEYTLESIAYTDADTGDDMDSIDFGKETDVTIRISSATGKFEVAGSPMVLNIMYLPTTESSYVNTTKTYQQDFTWDRKMLTTDTASNGENFGTDYQILTDITCVQINADIAEITFTADFSSFLQTFFADKDANDRNFLIWITPQDKDVTTTVGTDRNAVICDVNSLEYDTTDSSLFLVDGPVQFYEHPDYSATPYSDFKGWPTDTIYSQGFFKVKKGSFMQSLRIVIEAEPTDTTKQSFKLEEKIFNTEQFLGPDDIEEINIEEQRQFRIPTEYPWNDMNLVRHDGIDDAEYAGYKFQYGFKLRHETWLQLVNYYRDFLEQHTQDWSTYSNTSGWTTYYNVYASVRDANGNVTEFQHQCDLLVKQYSDYYESGVGEPILTIIQTFVDDDVEGEVDIEEQILIDEITIVRATFTGNFATFPSGGYDGYYGILYLDIFGAGGINKIDQCSSEISRVSDSAWLGYTVDSANATLTKVNDTTITLEARINYEKLDPNNIYVIGARLGLRIGTDSLRVFEDDVPHLWEDGVSAAFEA